MPFMYLLIAVLGVLAPGLAEAATSSINPIHGNAWDLYVFGNGTVVYQILMGVKMLMVPDAGTSGFMALLLLLATIGFIVLAVAAGFDPGKNLMKMFGYIFVVWMVTLFSTKLTANVQIIDLAVADSSVPDGHDLVTGVPALVALPAALTSQVGNYFTKNLETYFSMPSDFKMTGGSAGQFNLFAKMIDESSQYSFSSPALKQSLAAYTANCVVPALATNRLVGPGAGGVTLSGLDALLKSTNLMETFASATHKALLTSYYGMSKADGGQGTVAGTMGAMGTLLTCEEAYNGAAGAVGGPFPGLKADMEANAQALLDKGSEAWKKTGVMVPFEAAMSSMLAGATAAGSVGANYSRPNGYILQQGFLNSMSGSFRSAAIQTNNQELMTAVQLSQAEASQKSAWVAGFNMFNNMMGYVYSVLQAFIFAITPLIVVALLVPGLGKGIFANYAQILIWMTLWMPMLAVINFVITLFSGDSASGLLAMDGGLTANNHGLFIEKNKNMVIAAQFLGTMTPMLSWGIVKGAMAFTEFISHGVGSKFAEQAGAGAATGNLSMNQLSMDNASMNKYATSFSSNVGFQGTNAFAGAGAMGMSHGLGGQMTSAHGSNVDAKRSLQDSISSRMAESESTKAALTSAMEHSSSVQDALSRMQKGEFGENTGRAVQKLRSMAETAGTSETTGKSDSTGNTATNAAQAGHGQSREAHAQAGAEGSLGGSIGFVGGKVSTGAGVRGSNQDNSSTSNTLSNVGGTSNSAGSGASTGTTVQAGDTATTVTTATSGFSSSHGKSHDEQSAFRKSMGDAIASETAYQHSLETSRTLANSYGLSSGMTAGEVVALESQMDAIQKSALNETDMRSRMDGLNSQLASRQSDAMSAYEGVKHSAAGGVGGGHSSSLNADHAAITSAVDSQRAAVSGRVQSEQGATRATQQARQSAGSSAVSAGQVPDNAAVALASGLPLAKQIAKADKPSMYNRR